MGDSTLTKNSLHIRLCLEDKAVENMGKGTLDKCAIEIFLQQRDFTQGICCQLFLVLSLSIV